VAAMLPSARVRAALAAVVPAVLLIAIAIWEIVAAARAPAGVPGDGDWARAAAVVRAQHRPGQLIVFAPSWVDPVGRLHLGDLLPIEAAARMDADRYAVIWELSIRGARAPETRGLPVGFEARAGAVTVRRFEREPAIVVADLVGLASSIEVAGGPRPKVVIAEVGFAPRRCVQVSLREAQTAELTFPRLPLGDVLVGHVGLADVFTRRDARDPVDIGIAIAGAPAAARRIGVDDGWVRFEAPTVPGVSSVTVRVRVPERGDCRRARDAGRRPPDVCGKPRLVCFAAEARR
jgi:hypothetical protein